MSDTIGKLHFKLGKLEIEFEGRESFLINDLSIVLTTLTGFYKEHIAEQLPDLSTDTAMDKSSIDKDHKFDFSTSTIASRMDATSGPDLIIAASAFLTFVKNEDEFSRTAILDEMKTATSFYNKNMASNLNPNLESLVKSKRLNETATSTYALTVNEKDAVEKILA